MKKLIYLLLLLPFIGLGQVSTGQETQFDYGIQNLAPQTISTPTYFGCIGVDGTMGRTPAAYVTPTARTLNINGVSQDLTANRSWVTAQADTGVLTFAGLTTNSSTTINIGAATGYVVDNETTPSTPTSTFVNYAGATGVTVTTVGSGQSSYVMLSSAGVISFQNTFPTSAERKTKIWLGKVSHPAGSVTLVVNEPDYITSPMAFARDWFQDLGPFVNNGVYPSANGANLNVNISSGTITGDGINFVTSRTNPNHVSMGPNVIATFTYRTQTGGVTTGVTAVNPGSYDVAGTVTAIAGSANQATIQYWYAIPGQGYIVQYGQTIYSTFTAAVAAVGKESFVKWSNLVGNSIPIAALVVTKGCTDLTNLTTAQFFLANKNGDFFGATAGVSTATLQSTYSNSLAPQITTTTALGAFELKRGSAADSDNVLRVSNGAGTQTAAFTGNGDLTCNSVSSPDLVHLAGAETITGVKTFNDGKIGHRNVANTFTSFFTNSNTASRTYTLPDKSDTLLGATDILEQTSSVSGTAYTLQASDANKRIIVSHAFNVNFALTVPNNATIPYPIGTRITITDDGAQNGYVTITGGVGVAFNDGSTSPTTTTLKIRQNGSYTLVKTATDKWYSEPKNLFFFSPTNNRIEPGSDMPFYSPSVTSNSFFGSFFGISNTYSLAIGSGSNGFSFNYFTNLIPASGTFNGLNFGVTFNPTSGTAVYNSFNLSPIINQTGGANGITRGLYCNPTLTSAFDFRAVEVISGSISYPYVAKSSTYSISNNDYLIDATSGTFTETLPTAVGCAGRNYVLKNSGSGAITIATTSSQTIDGASTYSLPTQYKYVHVVSNGANWIITANN